MVYMTLLDMYDQVLKFGSYIVDALVEYRQPIMIYIPPNGELRGGAWVVVDPSINPTYMEMFADQLSRYVIKITNNVLLFHWYLYLVGLGLWCLTPLSTIF